MCQMYPPSTSVGMPAVSQMARSAFGPARRFPPVMAAAAVEAHRGAVLDHLQAIALQLRLVDPAVAGRHILGRHGAAGLDEADGRDHACLFRALPVLFAPRVEPRHEWSAKRSVSMEELTAR